MMKNSNFRTLVAALVIMSALFTAGCAAKREGVAQTPAGGPGVPAPNNEGNTGGGGGGGTLPGTSDSGGGTGVAGKVFESYIVDPLQLPAFKQHLEEKLKNVKSATPEEKSSYEMFFKMKAWYVAPVEFDKVGKDVLGISFVKSDTQQIARQSLKEIWINKTIFDKMNTREQAELLLHEMVMSMYFMKFMPMGELCKASILVFGGKDSEGCLENAALIEKMMPPEAARPLNNQDNENIRFVTGWMLQNLSKTVDEEQLVRVLFNKGFDRRLYNPRNYGLDQGKSEDLKVTSAEIFNAINGAKLTGQMPNLCTRYSDGRTQPCAVDFQRADLTYSSLKLPGFHISFNLAGENPVGFSFSMGDETSLTSLAEGERGEIFMHAAVDTREKVKIGDRMYSAFMMFRKDSGHAWTGLILDYIVLKPAVVTSIDKNRENICLSRAPLATKFFDDVLIIKRAGHMAGMAEHTVTAMPTFVLCSKENVE